MSIMRKWFKRIALIPAPAILFVLALGLVAYGVFALSPWFENVPVCAVVGNNLLAEHIIGVVFILIGGCRLLGAGWGNRKLMLAVPYGMSMAYFFIALAHVEVVGWFPPTWLPLALCGIISGICRLALLYGPDRD